MLLHILVSLEGCIKNGHKIWDPGDHNNQDKKILYGKDWCPKASVCIVASGYGSSAAPDFWGNAYPTPDDALRTVTNDSVSITKVGNGYSSNPYQLPESDKTNLINHLKAGNPAIACCSASFPGGIYWSGSGKQHYIAILDINDNNEIYVANPWYSGNKRGWMHIDEVFNKGCCTLFLVKSK